MADKLLSVAIPSYNSEAYMAHAIESLLPGGDELEILVVDDGSKDRTAEIADDFERRYPGVVRAIHQENAGHGGAVMAGLRNATGLYFKVIDSDDWADAEAYPRVLETLRRFSAPDERIDMLISNYIYDKVGVTHKHVMNYHHALPQGRVFDWDEARHFRKGQYILMHSVIYNTEMLRRCGLDLPLHTFYVDELYVYVPLTAVKRMYYLDVDFYHYFIGRDDQSVQEAVMTRRIDQALKVNKLLVEQADRMTGLLQNQERLAGLPLRFVPNATVREIQGFPDLTDVVLSDGQTVPCRTLLSAVGLRPERELLPAAVPDWAVLAGNCSRIHPRIESVLLEGEQAAAQALMKLR